MIKKCISLQLLLCMMLLFCTPCITTVNAVEYVDATRYYYYQLSDLEQKIYDSLLEQIDGEEQITISFTNTNTVEEWEAAIDRVNRALVADQPEYSLYWYDAYLSSFGDIIVIGRVSAEGPDWLLSTVQARIDQYVASIDPNADGYSQIYELYQIMYNEVYYDDYYNLIGHNVSTIYSVYGCLGYGVSVCDGFAYSVKIRLLRRACMELYSNGGWTMV